MSDPLARIAPKRANSARFLRPNTRLAVTLLALLCFTFQAFVTQTHIHLGSHGSALGETGLVKVSAPDTGNPDKFPPIDDPANCPICHEVMMVGHFITPAALAALPPTLSVSAIAIFIEAPVIFRPVSHSWRGRAPPRA